MDAKSGISRVGVLGTGGYFFIKSLVFPSDIYAQEKKADTSGCDTTVTRQEKIDRLHPTSNRIMPSENIEEVISTLTNGILLQPAGKTMNLYYGQDIAADLNNLPMKKPGATLRFQAMDVDKTFKAIYNGIDNIKCQNPQEVLNKKQMLKNFTELEGIVKRYTAHDTDWKDAIKDGKITATEFQNLDKGIYGVLVYAVDKKGMIIESAPMLMIRGEDYSGAFKEVPVEKRVEVPVPYETVVHDTVRVPTEKPEKEPTFALSLGAGGIYDKNNGKVLPQGRISALFDNTVEVGVDGAYLGWSRRLPDIEFPGPFGNTSLHSERKTIEKALGLEVLAGMENFRVGAGANYYVTQDNTNLTFDEILRDHAGNIVKTNYNKYLGSESSKSNHWAGGPRLALQAGRFELAGGADYAKGYKPTYNINLNFQILRK